MFEYKTKIKGSVPGDDKIRNVQISVLLQDISNFWRAVKYGID